MPAEAALPRVGGFAPCAGAQGGTLPVPRHGSPSPPPTPGCCCCSLSRAHPLRILKGRSTRCDGCPLSPTSAKPPLSAPKLVPKGMSSILVWHHAQPLCTAAWRGPWPAPCRAPLSLPRLLPAGLDAQQNPTCISYPLPNLLVAENNCSQFPFM